ncbi:monoacylglycerol lipase ABHD12 [Denticeps clupeoides]|uniref:AB hydrolase-1 domain-containing protein n=1 Tax=Denticeps clupeoides TaxID=299321 RepID=A0AAY4EXA7_9TELE|nr:monoacylglycerol lipase ABHD12-like [Denticeps clupeoides]
MRKRAEPAERKPEKPLPGGSRSRKAPAPAPGPGRCAWRTWLTWLVLGVCAAYLCAPLLLRLFPAIMHHAFFSHVVRIPFLTDLSRPEDLSLNHTVNLYLTSEQGVTLGVWHTVPERQWQEAQGKDPRWYEAALGNGAPVIIYLHGNTGSRAMAHRVGIVNVLSSLDFHVLAMDYRGFGDSSGEPTEPGLTTDALCLYKWVKERSRDSVVVIWGHSLGSGVSTNTAVILQEQGTTVDGVILEGAFTNARQETAHHPFSWFYWRFPWFEYFFLDLVNENKIIFPSDENVKKMQIPLLILHSEDDPVVPSHMGKELYRIAKQAATSEKNVKLVLFEAPLGYKHNGLYKDERLPGIVREFVQSLK